MKLIIQIPCFNERQTLRETVADLPRSIPGIDEVELLIIDDGSTDGTAQLARELGIQHIVRFPQNRGLAKGFMAGIDACLKLGADIIVNTDADNQYSAADIPKLVQPILEGRADLVVGNREVEKVEGFSPAKRKLQRIGSWVVRLASRTDVPDATSGFRAIGREAAMRMFVVSEFSYTLETIIQAGQAHLAVTAVPIRTNPQTRESRLFRSIPQYLRRSGATIVRVYTMYKPLRAFLAVAALLLLAGSTLGVRFLYYHFTEEKTGHIQSLILASILLVVAFIVTAVGLLADLVGANRKLLEDVVTRLRRVEYDLPGRLAQPPAPANPPSAQAGSPDSAQAGSPDSAPTSRSP